MSMIFWMGLVLVTLFSLLAVKPLFLGFCILGSALLMSFLMSFFSFSWYAFMFFLMYMGGLLVLFFYISSLNSKPVFKMLNLFPTFSLESLTDFFFFLFYKMSSKFICLFVFFGFFCYSWSSVELSFFKNMKLDFSQSLFKSKEMWFLFMVVFILLLVLWVMTKLTFRSRGALRPFF